MASNVGAAIDVTDAAATAAAAAMVRARLGSMGVDESAVANLEILDLCQRISIGATPGESRALIRALSSMSAVAAALASDAGDGIKVGVIKQYLKEKGLPQNGEPCPTSNCVGCVGTDLHPLGHPSAPGRS